MLRDKQTKQPFGFEFLVTTKEQERLAIAFSRDLKRAGITLRVRVVDAVQYDRRRISYDYDMIEYRWDQSLSPGNEQAFYWGAAAADEQGTRNYMGVKSPAIDAMIAALLKARERGEFVSAVRALDRLLISGFYVVPLFHLPEQWVARWTTIAHPDDDLAVRLSAGNLVAAAMILGDPQTAHVQEGEPATLDDLFRQRGRAPAGRHRAVRPAQPVELHRRRTAPPHLCAGRPHRLRHCGPAAARLGLSTDSIVALQLPNTVESVLTLLGVLRAGLIAAPLPLLWRRIDAAAALNRVGAQAIVTSAQIGATDHCSLGRDIAAEVFPIRYVCSFGENLPDGVIPFDDLMAAAPLLDPPVPAGRDGNPAAHAAVVTFEVTADGLMPVARNHMELIAGGQAVRLEAQLEDNATILASCTNSSFAGLAATTLPWLLTGGTLSLHQPFDAATFAEQCRSDRCDTVVVPGPLVTRIAQAGLLTHEELKTIAGALARAGAADGRFGMAAFSGCLGRCPSVRRDCADRCASRPGRRPRRNSAGPRFRAPRRIRRRDQCSKPR